MTRKAWMVVGGVLVLALVVGGARAAGDKAERAGDRVAKAADKGGEFGPLGQMLGRAAAKLELTDAQKAEIKTKVATHREEIVGALGKVRDATRRLDDLTLAEPLDQEAVRSAATQLGQALGDAALVKAKVLAEIKPLLTPEQIDRLKTLRADTRGKIDKAVGQPKVGQPKRDKAK
ncbi:MAG: periplasmic heavy metal sensor [Armatimonadetes bacterium]|nr:periplasmic heavy metal sensor [Armatimonadota bacterium]